MLVFEAGEHAASAAIKQMIIEIVKMLRMVILSLIIEDFLKNASLLFN